MKLLWFWLLLASITIAATVQAQPQLAGENVENPSPDLFRVRNIRAAGGNIAVDLRFDVTNREWVIEGIVSEAELQALGFSPSGPEPEAAHRADLFTSPQGLWRIDMMGAFELVEIESDGDAIFVERNGGGSLSIISSATSAETARELADIAQASLSLAGSTIIDRFDTTARSGLQGESVVSQNVLFGSPPLIDILNLIFAPALYMRVSVFAGASGHNFSLLFKLRSDPRGGIIDEIIRSFEILN